MFKKVVSVFLAVLMSVSVLAGCGASKDANKTAPANTAAQAEQPKKQEKIKLVYLTNVNVDTEGYSVNDNPYKKFIEEKNNVELELISESSNYAQKMYTVMASGDLPDYMMISARKDVAQFANDGLIVPLDALVEKSANLKANMTGTAWDMAKVNGKVFGIPMERYDKVPQMSFVQKKWVENLNIDMNKLKSIDDYYGMLKSFARNDPDKNGKDDTFGIAATNSVPASLDTFINVFDADKYKMVNGQMTPPYIQDGYKDWLKFMNKLYTDKILDPEYLVNTKVQMWDKVKNGKYGLFHAFWSLQEYSANNGKREDLLPLKPPVKKDGTDAKYTYASGPVRHYIAVTKKCKNPERVVAMMDWACSEEGGNFIHAGIPTLDYDMVNGKLAIKDNRKGKNWAWRFITMGVQKSKLDTQIKDLLEQSWGKLGVEQLELSNKWGTYDEFVSVVPYFKELGDFDLTTKVDEFKGKAIMGKINIDAEWDAYVAMIKKSGGDQTMKLYTEWYNKNKK